jgi:transcriptional regulator with XRE-family HTH domain
MHYSSQIRAARGLLGWSQIKLAEVSGVAISTVKRMEASDILVRATTSNIWKIQKALESAGVIFIEPQDLGPGVRMSEDPALISSIKSNE